MGRKTNEEREKVERQIRINNFVKENIDALESMGRELRQQLRFLEIEIREDREKLEKYKAEFGDLYYRARMGEEWGEPTELKLKPSVSEYRMTIKSILDSLTLIETKLGVDTGRGELSVSGNEESGSGSGDDDFNADEWFDKTRKKPGRKKDEEED